MKKQTDYQDITHRQFTKAVFVILVSKVSYLIFLGPFRLKCLVLVCS